MMKLVEPNYNQLLIETHRRWIETRDPKDGDRFADVVLAAHLASRKAMTPSTFTAAGDEQPAFDYFECKVCGFSSVQHTAFNGSEECPLCAGDSGHSNLMSRRTARSTDKPEGRDARKS